MTKEEKDKLRDVVYNQRHFILDDIAALTNLTKSQIRKSLVDNRSWPRFLKCPHCGKEIFITYTNRQQKFCCPEHKQLYWSKNRKKDKLTICARCGKEFYQYRFRNSKYCCIQCAALDREQIKREDKKEK
jgi:DNA-directed RNA polymerase beta' subunit